MSLLSFKTFGYVALFVFFSSSPCGVTTLEDEGYTLYDEEGRQVNNTSDIVEFERIERSPLQDSRLFTVRYLTTIQDLDVGVCLSNNGLCTSNAIPRQESIERWEVSFEAPHNLKEPILYFETVNRAMSLTLNNDESHAATQIDGLGDLPVPVTNPATEIVYNPGEDTVITGDLYDYRRYDPEDKLPELRMTAFLYDRTHREVLEQSSQNVERSYFFRWTRPEFYEKVGYRYTIRTSDLSIIGGYLMFRTNLPLNQPLVKKLWQAKVLPLRRSDQSHPFGPNFIHIWLEYYERQNMACK
ncbi:hypothetical protein PoB_001337200 [Plakobranchus ocellatus]|uniref:CBM39 domain-containing protein n=1 Tax=Plakobranchus ocellatus TaxID=259542 RepID=A0AAV3YV94_9GAST|nr:hypothetical protein PoB_001337200 [Plakobranchus ocellatus]